VFVEADDQLRLVPQQHAAVAFRTGQTPLAGAGSPLSTPVHRVAPVTVLWQAMLFAPQMRRLIRALGGTLDHHQLLAMPGGKPVQHRLDRPRPRPAAAPAYQYPRIAQLERHTTPPSVSRGMLTALQRRMPTPAL
jgi:hypothetical protein